MANVCSSLQPQPKPRTTFSTDFARTLNHSTPPPHRSSQTAATTMEYEFVVAHDDQQPQQYQPQVSPNSAAFLALPDDSGPFLFSSDSSSSNHSISSNSPPNDWGTTWSEQDQLLDYSSHFHSAGIDPTQLHSFDLSFTSQNYVDLLNATFPAQPTVIQPGVLLQKPNPSLTVQSQTTQLATPVTPITEDLNMAVKRLVGITSARIPGQYEPQCKYTCLLKPSFLHS